MWRITPTMATRSTERTPESLLQVRYARVLRIGRGRDYRVDPAWTWTVTIECVADSRLTSRTSVIHNRVQEKNQIHSKIHLNKYGPVDEVCHSKPKFFSPSRTILQNSSCTMSSRPDIDAVSSGVVLNMFRAFTLAPHSRRTRVISKPSPWPLDA